MFGAGGALLAERSRQAEFPRLSGLGIDGAYQRSGTPRDCAGVGTGGRIGLNRHSTAEDNARVVDVQYAPLADYYSASYSPVTIET